MSSYIGQVPGHGQIQYFTFIATAGQTVFSGIDSNKYVLNYSAGFCDVFLNGRRLTPTSDYTATNGSTITLQSATSLNDVIFVASASTFDTANWVTNAVNYVYTATAGQTIFTGSDDNANTLSYVNGTILVSVNGINIPQSDYTATNGTSVVLNSGVNVGDIVQIFSLRTMAVVNFLPLTGGTVTGTITVGNSSVNTQITAGNIALNGSTLLIGNSTSNVVLTGTTLTISNSTSNVSISPGPASINAISTNTFTVGNTLYVVSNGNVGLGTTSPLSKFTVSKDGISGAPQITVNGSTNSNQQMLIGYDTTSDYGYLQALIQGTGYRNLILNGSGGNVGIGVSPVHKFQVFNSLATNTASSAYVDGDSIIISLRSNGANTGASIQLSDNASYASYIGLVGNTGGAIGIAPQGTEAIRILPNGNIGIGNTAPGNKLTVNGQVRATYNIIEDASPSGGILSSIRNSTINSTSGAKLLFDVNNVGSASIGIASDGTGSLGFYANSYTTERMRINANGALLIGSSSSSKLGPLTKFSSFVAGGTSSLGSFSTNGVNPYDTQIPINAGDGGGTLLLLASRNTSDGLQTHSAVYIVRFYYNGNNAPTTTYVGGSLDFLTFGKSANNTLTITNSGSGNMVCSWFGNI